MSSDATEPARRSRGWLGWIVAAAFALIAAALAALLVGALRTPGMPEVRLSIVTPVTSDPPSFALSPDGLKIVFSAADFGTQRLWLRSLSDTVARPLPGTDFATLPFRAPNSRSIAFFADGRLKRLDPSRWLMRNRCPSRLTTYCCFSGTGTGPPGVRVMNNGLGVAEESSATPITIVLNWRPPGERP